MARHNFSWITDHLCSFLINKFKNSMSIINKNFLVTPVTNQLFM
jgi:hypothetical protein